MGTTVAMEGLLYSLPGPQNLKVLICSGIFVAKVNKYIQNYKFFFYAKIIKILSKDHVP